MAFSVCQPVDRNEDPLSSPYKVAIAFYWNYLYWVTMLLDTIVLVGKKKFHKVTTSHLSIHCFGILHFWIHARYAPGGHGTLDIMTGINAVMFSVD